MTLFTPKGYLMTCGIKNSIEEGEITYSDVQNMILKHLNNMGEECSQDNKTNKQAIDNNNGRVVSVFNVKGQKFYVITDGLGLEEEYPEYPMTTVLYPHEY